MKTKNSLVLLVMTMATLAIVPSASADHGWYDCHEDPDDPCDDKLTNGCKGTVGVNCEYDKDLACRDTNNQVGDDECYHVTRNCQLSLLGTCVKHGEPIQLRPLLQVLRL